MSAQASARVGALRLVARVSLAPGVAFVSYFLVYRPRQLLWGATDVEIASTWRSSCG